MASNESDEAIDRIYHDAYMALHAADLTRRYVSPWDIVRMMTLLERRWSMRKLAQSMQTILDENDELERRSPQ